MLLDLSHLLRQNDQQTTENWGQVKEEIQRVLDAVGRASPTFLHDDLCVVQNESAHNEQTKVQMCLQSIR